MLCHSLGVPTNERFLAIMFYWDCWDASNLVQNAITHPTNNPAWAMALAGRKITPLPSNRKSTHKHVSSSGMHSMMAMYTILSMTNAPSGHHQALQKAMVRFGSDSTVHLAVRSSLWLDHLQLLFQHLQATLQLNLNDKGQIPCINMWLDLLKGARNQTR